MAKYKIRYDELIFILKLRKLSATDLAELIGVKRQTLYYWKTNGTSLDNIRVMAHYLKVSVDDLIEGEVD